MPTAKITPEMVLDTARKSRLAVRSAQEAVLDALRRSLTPSGYLRGTKVTDEPLWSVCQGQLTLLVAYEFRFRELDERLVVVAELAVRASCVGGEIMKADLRCGDGEWRRIRVADDGSLVDIADLVLAEAYADAHRAGWCDLEGAERLVPK